MGSILPEYQYDIFVSYRQKDNQYDGWVSEFVHNLNQELKATFKKDISIYFDENPEDGLHENHEVESSLNEKIKSVLFVPIISQTYCDPECYAWQHELLPFIELAKNDKFGLNVKLNNGNTAKRVLPIRIHEIENTDEELFEEATGGVPRSIDFIYKSSGVNRPLRAQEVHPEVNVHKTIYRDQINKVANAIKELIYALQHKPLIKSKHYLSEVENEKDIPEVHSLAVLPFVNMSGDPAQEYFCDGISEELITALTKIPEMKVVGRTSSFAYKNKTESIKEIGEKLGVSTLLEGSIRKAGSHVRITAKLINAYDGFHLWNESYDRELTDIFEVQDDITSAIIEALKVHFKKDIILISPTESINAYSIYLQARHQLALRGDHLNKARSLFQNVVDIDSGYSPGYSGLARTISLMPNWTTMSSKEAIQLGKEAAYKALEIDPNNVEALSVLGTLMAYYEWDWKEAEKVLLKSQQLSSWDAEVINFVGDFYQRTWNPNAISTELHALEMDPLHPIKHNDLARAYLLEGDLSNVVKYASRAMELDSSLIYPARYLVIAYIGLLRFDKAQETIDKFKNQTGLNELLLLEMEAWINTVKGNSIGALEIMKVLEEKATIQKVYYARIAQLYLLLDMSEEAANWIERAYHARDNNLAQCHLISLPEKMPDHVGIQQALNKPELNELFKIRRANLSRRNME